MIISRFFFEVDGELKNRKAEEELDKRRTFLEEQARKSRLAVEARGNRKRTPQGNPVDEPTGQPTDKPDGVPLPSPSPSPLPTPSPKKQESVNTLSSFAGQKTTGKNGNCPHEEIINLYHEVLPELPGVRTWPENNRKILRTRWKEEPERQNLAWWRSYFEYIRESQFLMGREKDWMANLEWIVRPKNMTKILNGSYHKQRHGGIQAWLNQTENNSQPS
jgi:hypothetical protein